VGAVLCELADVVLDEVGVDLDPHARRNRRGSQPA
jgi:hypothetical protein